MRRMVGNQAIRLDDPVYQRAKTFFAQNLDAILNQAGDTPVFLGTLVSNVRDQQPFISTYRSEEQKAEIASLLQEASALYEAQRYKLVLELCEQILALHDEVAMAHYLKAQALEGLGKMADAREAYYRAKDPGRTPFPRPRKSLTRL